MSEIDLPTTNLRTPPARWSSLWQHPVVTGTISKSNGGPVTLEKLALWRWARDVGLRAARNVPGVLNITGGCTPVW